MNRFIPYVFTRIFAKKDTKKLLECIESEVGPDFKAFLCGFGVFSILTPSDDARMNIVSHSINSEMLKVRSPKILYTANLKILSGMVGDRFICVSSSIENDWLKLAPARCFDITVIKNPLDISEGCYDNVKLDFEYFVYCGRLSAEKNLASIIDAYLLSGVSEKLLVLGAGPYEEEIRTYVKKKGLCNSVLFLGYVSNPLAYISKARALLLNSIYEGLPTVAIEAMRVKTPLIIGDCSGAAYDVVPIENQKYIFKTRDVETFSKYIFAASKCEYPRFIYKEGEWSLGKALAKYAEY
jgi:glycosyltransferase involved in cell wall biosynthesis